MNNQTAAPAAPTATSSLDAAAEEVRRLRATFSDDPIPANANALVSAVERMHGIAAPLAHKVDGLTEALDDANATAIGYREHMRRFADEAHELLERTA